MDQRALRALVVSCAVLAGGAAPAGAGEERMLAALRARAERPPDRAFAARPDLRDVGPGHLLFSMTAPNNAVCVRAVNDVTGDHQDEIVVGIDQSGTDNVFCLDGASSGTATVVWSIQTNDGASGGSPYGDQSIVPISDPDGNGHQNVLVGTAWGGRTAYNLDSLDGAIRWRFDTYHEPQSGWVYSLAELNDITGDGVREVAFGAGSDNNTLYLVDGASSGGAQATVLWRYAAADAVMSVRDIGDVNGDGYHDVLAAVGDNGQALVCLSGHSTSPTGTLIWQYPAGVSVYACGVLPDVTGDGINEALAVVWTTDGSAIRCRNGATGAPVWSSTAVGDYGMMVDVLQDVTGDGKPEVIVSSWENAVIVLSGADGSLVWKTTVGTLNGGDVWTARAIDDLNGDGHQDVIAGSFDTYVYALDGVTGAVLWAYDTGNRVYSVAPVGDLDGNARPEVAVATQHTNNDVVVLVLDGDGSVPIFHDGFERGNTTVWSATQP